MPNTINTPCAVKCRQSQKQPICSIFSCCCVTMHGYGFCTCGENGSFSAVCAALRCFSFVSILQFNGVWCSKFYSKMGDGMGWEGSRRGARTLLYELRWSEHITRSCWDTASPQEELLVLLTLPCVCFYRPFAVNHLSTLTHWGI